MEQEIKVMKYAARMPFTLEQLELGQHMRWAWKANFDSNYEREVLESVFIPTDPATIEKFDALSEQLSQIESQLRGLGAEYDSDSESWDISAGEYDFTYAETEEEWIERCKQLDAETNTPA